MRRWLAGCLLLVCCASAAAGADHGVILLYHHVATDTPASTSVTPEQFTAHLDYLDRNGYRVIALRELLEGLYQDGPDVPDRAVAITFDDAYKSIFDTAYPLLLERRMPFTLFVATDAIDRAYKGYLSWQELRQMMGSGLLDVGAHSITHAHLLEGGGIRDDFTAWETRVTREIDGSILRLEQELPGLQVNSFAYPFGEWHPPLARMLKDRDLFGLAQNSGAASRFAIATAIPRFPFSRNSAGEQRLRDALRSRPLPVTDVDAGPMFIKAPEKGPEQLAFRLAAGNYDRTQLACYASAGTRLPLERQNDDFSVRLPELRPGRSRVNCTAPSTAQPGAYHWFSHQWVLADAAGRWLNY